MNTSAAKVMWNLMPTRESFGTISSTTTMHYSVEMVRSGYGKDFSETLWSNKPTHKDMQNTAFCFQYFAKLFFEGHFEEIVENEALKLLDQAGDEYWRNKQRLSCKPLDFYVRIRLSENTARVIITASIDSLAQSEVFVEYQTGPLIWKSFFTVPIMPLVK